MSTSSHPLHCLIGLRPVPAPIVLPFCWDSSAFNKWPYGLSAESSACVAALTLENLSSSTQVSLIGSRFACRARLNRNI